MEKTLYDWCVENRKEDLLKDWSFAKNEKTPKEYLAKSSKKVWWECRFCGHEWESKISNRTVNNRNCPSCTMKSTSFGEQALFYYIKQIFPDAKNRFRDFGIELDIFIPSKNLGIEFDGFFWHNSDESISREKKKFKICREKKIKLIRIRDSKAVFGQDTCDRAIMIENLKDINQLQNIIRILLKELDPASNPMTRKNPRQDWSTIDKKINIDKDRFDILKDKYKREEKNSFTYEFPKLAEEWNTIKNKTLNPKAFSKNSTMKVWWKCEKCGYEWQAKIVNRTAGYNNCPVCSNKLLKLGYNDFATLHPELLEEWDYKHNIKKPSEILMKTAYKVWWRCKKCGHSWMATLGDRARTDKPSNCPKCKIDNASFAKHRKALSRGSLDKTNSEILVEWDYKKNELLPSEITFGSNRKVWWKCCYCGYSWQSSPNNRIRKKSKCPFCHYITK